MRRRAAIALAFLTRLPLNVAASSEVDVGRSVAFFPLVGVALGAILLAVATLLDTRLPPGVVAVVLAALLALLTGGLHLDGVADVFDALGAQGADRARRLKILRDSRIGAHGASALLLLVLAKVAALQALLADGRLAALIAFPVVGRCAAVLAIVSLPYARAHGLGSAFRAHARASDVLAALASTVLVTLATRGVLAALLATLLALAVAHLAARRFGGATGDVYGATVELAEVAFLILVVAAA